MAPEDISSEGRPDPDKPVLKGGGNQIIKDGDFATANTDFDRLQPIRIEIRSREVRTGMLQDGRVVIVRPVSEPTLEVQSNGVPDLKIRYRS